MGILVACHRYRKVLHAEQRQIRRLLPTAKLEPLITAFCQGFKVNALHPTVGQIVVYVFIDLKGGKGGRDEGKVK